MSGLRPRELMHEWMEEDTPGFDIPGEQITAELLRDNALMLELIRELGAENELRNRVEKQQNLP